MFSALNLIVRTNRYKSLTMMAIIIAGTISVFSFQSPRDSISELTERYFTKHLESVKEKLHELKESCAKNEDPHHLQKKFMTSRIAFKKLAVLSDYFNAYETRFLNGPALFRMEEGLPDSIVAPQGFQAIEELLFREPVNPGKSIPLIDKMVFWLERMEEEEDRLNKFTPELVWDAIRASTIRLMTLGITGFDSPVALQSLPEAIASIDGIKNVLLIFYDSFQPRYPELVPALIRSLDSANAFLKEQKSFNEFDRLEFITGYIQPFFGKLAAARSQAGIPAPAGLHPVNPDASSLFEKDFFHIDFFSPGEPFLVTNERIALGKKLFSDPIFSGSKTRSCASCHRPGKAFTDGLKVPLMPDNKTKLIRNTPTLWNAALQSRQFYDTRSEILEDQLKEVVHSHGEMNGSLAVASSELQKNATYVALFNEAYKGEQQPVSPFNIANAISSYVRSLVALNSRFDRFAIGDTTSTLSPAEKEGFNLFAGKAKCATCHFMPLFNGLVPPDFTETETEVLGVPYTRKKRKPSPDTDPGKFSVTHSAVHKFSFKTPTLRNIELTAPYMHNGVFETLEEVMDFYNRGGGAGLGIAPEYQTLPAEKLQLSRREIADIIAFLRSLTDPVVYDHR